MLEVAANITHICLRSLLPIVTGYESTSIDVLMGTVSVACPGRVLCPLRNTHREYYRHATSQRFRASKSRATICWGGMGQTKDAEARISIRRIIDASDESEFEIEELSSGFCNSVYLVKAEQDRQVVKLYSELSLLRTEPRQRGVIDEQVRNAGLGPAVRFNTSEGISHTFVSGRILEENDMHTRRDIGVAAAKLVAKFHALPIPLEFDANEPLVWKWLRVMLGQIGKSNRLEVLPKTVNLADLRSEADRMEHFLRTRQKSIVLAHGDLKPSNIMLVQEDPVELQLIDLELAGPNYRGFDLMKLFRTSPESFNASCFADFLAVYCESAGLGESVMREIEVETRVFEPLTWLEAAVFFALLLVTEAMEEEERNTWEKLLIDRWERYLFSAEEAGLP